MYQLGYNKHLRKLPEHLNAGEEMVHHVYGYLGVNFSGNSAQNALLAATNKRLLFFGLKVLFGYELNSIAYDKVISIETSIKNRLGKVTINLSGNKIELQNVDEKLIGPFVEFVNGMSSHK